MIIEGFSNPAHIVRSFLANEYAFELEYPNKIVRIAHTKGAWIAVKISENRVNDFFVIQDCFSGFDAKNEMTASLIETIREAEMKENTFEFREADGEFISKILKIWAGSFEKIIKVRVVQPGRNAWVDERVGDFILSPRPEDFRS